MKETILITGGSGKIGSKFIGSFLEKRWRVLFTSTNDDSLKKTLDKFDNHPDLVGFVVDFFDRDAISNFVQRLFKDGEKVQHLVNNARSIKNLKVDRRGVTNREDFKNEFFLDVIIPYELSMELALATDLELKTVTNIGSQYGVVAYNRNLYENFEQESFIQYSVSKAALIQLTKELAVRLASKKIRVNCIAYGGVEGRGSASFKKRYSSLVPIGRMLTEDEVVSPLEFIVDSRSSALTGHTLAVDGGWSVW